MWDLGFVKDVNYDLLPSSQDYPFRKPFPCICFFNQTKMRVFITHILWGEEMTAIEREFITHGLQEGRDTSQHAGPRGEAPRSAAEGQGPSMPRRHYRGFMGKGKLSQGEKLESHSGLWGVRAISRSLIPGVIIGNEFCLLKPKTRQKREGPWALDSFTCMLEVSWQGNHVPSLRTGLLWEGGSLSPDQRAPDAEASRT